MRRRPIRPANDRRRLLHLSGSDKEKNVSEPDDSWLWLCLKGKSAPKWKNEQERGYRHKCLDRRVRVNLVDFLFLVGILQTMESGRKKEQKEEKTNRCAPGRKEKINKAHPYLVYR